MNKTRYGLTLGIVVLALSACRPAQKDPPMNWNQNRLDVSVSDREISPENPLAVIGAPELWKKTTGKYADNRRIRIGMVGTGIDYTNPDLREALAFNLGEMSDSARTNGVDDDGNGYADDVFGYDFYSGDGLPYDWNGHDTYTAGLIAASGRKNANVFGVAPNAELVVARYLGPDGRKTRTTGLDAAEALYYVVQSGAKVVYFNWPQGGFDSLSTPLIVEAIRDGGKANILFVVPAGNSGNQVKPAFLTAIGELKNVIIVAGLDLNGRIKATSNSGRFLAELAAPSMGSVSFLPGSLESRDLETTSVAAAYVTGAAALLATLPGFGSVEKIREHLLKAAASNRSPEPLDVLSGGSLYLGSL